MSLLATLPMMGASLVWGPAAIYLAMNGSWIKAIVLCGWGLLVVSLIDNVLYPLLVAGELRLHTLAVFFAMLGGLIAFGVSGVVLGPVILAVTYGLLELWRIRGGGDLETSAPPAAVAVAREDH
jgi:predicted PurR-regulated permease PerM